MAVETQTLKLDSAFKPIELISWQDAISLVLLGKAYVIEAYEQFIRSAKRAWQVPAVIVLKRFVPKKIYPLDNTDHHSLI